MYTELWSLCAGPLVTVPRVGDKVYYFPQGHIEQVSSPIRLPSLQAASSASTIFASELPFCAGVSGLRCGVSGDQPGWCFCGPVQRNSASHGGNSVRQSSSRGTMEGVLHHLVHFWVLRRCLQFGGFAVHCPAGESSGVYLVGSEILGFCV